MRLSAVEKLVIQSPLRADMLRRLEAPRVLSDLGIGERSVWLDIGCGSGIGALLINQYLDCEKVVGIDVDPGMVSAAKEYVSHPPKWARNIRTDNIEFLCEDATRSTFPDCHFDAVFLFGVLHHIREWKKLISEVFRMLKEGGVFSLVEETLLPGSLSCSGRLGRCISRGYRLVGAVPISEGKLKDALQKSGFCIGSFKTIGLMFMSGCFVRATKGGA